MFPTAEFFYRIACLLGVALISVPSAGQAVDVELVGEAILWTDVETVADLPAAQQGWDAYSPVVRETDGTAWVKLNVRLNLIEGETAKNPVALAVQLTGFYDFYFDGVLIGSNRAAGRDAALLSRVAIPAAQATAGEHTILLRVVPLGLMKGDEFELWVRPAPVSILDHGIHPNVILVFLVAVTALVCGPVMLVMARRERKPFPMVAAASTCLSAGATIMLQQGQFMFNWPYQYADAVSVALDLAKGSFILSAAAFLFLVIRSVPLRIVCLAGWFGLSTQAPDYEPLLWLLIATCAGMFVWLVRRIKITQDERVALAVATERLKAELVRRHIQPHYLMNLLTALSELVETDPFAAQAMIEAMADEFRLLGKFADCSLVSMNEELDLCRSHLALMAKSKGTRWRLETEGLTGHEQVPPGILHTLFENAFSHNRYEDTDCCFTIRLDADGKVLEVDVPKAKPRDNYLGTGAGTRYIEARLQEFRPNSWTIDTLVRDDRWITRIGLEHPEAWQAMS